MTGFTNSSRVRVLLFMVMAVMACSGGAPQARRSSLFGRCRPNR